MNKFIVSLKQKAEENPLAAVVVVAFAVTATAKLIDATGHAIGASAFSREVNRRASK